MSDSYTKLLLHFNGASGSIPVTDSSYYNHTIISSASLDSSQYKFSSSSLYLSNNYNNFVRIDYTDILAYGSNDWTIDTWINFRTLPSSGYVPYYYSDGIISQNLAIRMYFYFITGESYGWACNMSSDGTSVTKTSIKAIPIDEGFSRLKINEWNHYAVERSGSLIRMFMNGTELFVGNGSSGSCDIFNNSFYKLIGSINTELTASVVNGWMDEFRISIGTARYSASFTPETTPYDDPNRITKILTTIDSTLR